MSIKLHSGWVTATCFMALFSGFVLAHGGATGIVKERMNVMSDMSKSMKKLKTMMRGQVQYDEELVRVEAQSIADHAGEHILKMFPEGSAGGASEAKPTIWKQWPKFERYSNELKVVATGLALAAGNTETESVKDSIMPGMNMGMNMGMDMGMDMDMGSNMMDTSSHRIITVESLSTMPATSLFRRLNKNCLACHTAFRSEKENAH